MSIIYLDTSALLKRYVQETGSAETRMQLESAHIVGTAAITRAEMAAALAKARRMRWLASEEAQQAWHIFLEDWPFLSVVEIVPGLVAQAGELAWTHNLRGYDAVHLAAALTWQDALGSPLTLAAFDKQLWSAAIQVGLAVWPHALESYFK